MRRVFQNLNEKQTTPPLKIFLQTYLPLPVHKSQPPPSPEIPTSPPPLPSAEPESLGNDQTESDYSLDARADNDMTGKHGKMESERKCFKLKLLLQR